MADEQLDALVEIQNTARVLGLRAYAWGGWVPDLYCGKLLRDHEDIDLFVLPAEKTATLEDLGSKLAKNGWDFHSAPVGALECKKDRVAAGLIFLRKDGEKVVWEPLDRPLRIEFPFGWFKDDFLSLLGRKISYTDARLTYCIKATAMEKYPKQTRPKDIEDIKILSNIFVDQGADISETLAEFKWVELVT